MTQPAIGNRIPQGMPWALDNGCFSGRFDDRRFMNLVSGEALFCALPDVVGDWTATLERSTPWIDPVRARGGRPAIVLQDGATVDTVPWTDVDAVFIGGSTKWKLGPKVPGLIAEARRRGAWAHMGRVNSCRRLKLARAIGCQSADGTFLAWAPDHNAKRIIGWLTSLEKEPCLMLV